MALLRNTIVFSAVLLLVVACQSAGTTDVESPAKVGEAPTPTVVEPEGATGEEADDAGEIRVIEIRATEFAFEPTVIEVDPGERVRFVITNEGTLEHEFRLTNQHEIDEHIAEGHEGEHGGDAQMAMEDEPIILVAAGETATLEVTIPDDPTVYTMIACLLPAHYEAGMKGEIRYR